MRMVGFAVAMLAVLAVGFVAPRWASLTVTDEGALLAWHPVPDAIGYRVWRLDLDEGEWTTIGTTRDTTFLDRENRAEGPEIRYRVSGVDSELDESPLSPDRQTGEPDTTSGKGDHHGRDM